MKNITRFPEMFFFGFNKKVSGLLAGKAYNSSQLTPSSADAPDLFIYSALQTLHFGEGGSTLSCKRAEIYKATKSKNNVWKTLLVIVWMLVQMVFRTLFVPKRFHSLSWVWCLAHMNTKMHLWTHFPKLCVFSVPLNFSLWPPGRGAISMRLQ